MTKIAIIVLSVLLAVSCGQKSSTKVEIPSSVIDSLHVQKELGEVSQRYFEGTIPAADCPGIVYKLTLYNQENSGDGVFALSMTYLEAENGKDMTFDSQGKWYTLKGDGNDPDATVYQLIEYGSNYPTNFLFQTDSLTMLAADMLVPDSGLNYTLQLKK